MATDSGQVRDRVRAILEQQVAAVDSPEVAAMVVGRVREATQGASEADRANAARRAPVSALGSIEAGRRARPAPVRLADVLVKTANQSVAVTDEATAVAEARMTCWAPARTGCHR